MKEGGGITISQFLPSGKTEVENTKIRQVDKHHKKEEKLVLNTCVSSYCAHLSISKCHLYFSVPILFHLSPQCDLIIYFLLL